MAQDTGANTLNMQFDTTDTSEMDGKYLTFWTDNQLFAVPIADVVQIVGVQTITEIPEFPYYAKGIINLRGSIIPIIDVRVRFGKPEVPYNEHTCIIVANIRDTLIGFIVEGVDEVTAIEDEEIAPPPTFSGDRQSEYLTGVGKHDNRVILLLDTQKILSDEQMQSFAQAIS